MLSLILNVIFALLCRLCYFHFVFALQYTPLCFFSIDRGIYAMKLLICDETSLIFYQFLINFFLVGRNLLCFLFFFILLFNHIPP